MLEPPESPPALRVLVIEDDIDSGETFAQLLTALGQEVKVAVDGETGLHIAASWRPHVIFLDLDLPVMDGFEVARRLRRQTAGRIVALTGFGRSIDHERSRDAGCDQHLVKPPQLSDILRVLNRR
jgi:CheY-like chemotaxis protein